MNREQIRRPDAYSLGYIPKELTTLRFKQGLPSQLIANECMNDSICSSDLYRDIDDTTEKTRNGYSMGLCVSCNTGLCQGYKGLCSETGCSQNIMYYEPVVPINRGLCPLSTPCAIRIYDEY